VQEEVAQGGVEGGVARAEQQQGAACSLAVEWIGVVDRGEAAAEPESTGRVRAISRRPSRWCGC